MSKIIALNKENPIYLFDITLLYSEQKEKHTHNVHELFIALNGAGEQFTPAGKIKIKEGDICFFPEGVKHMGNGSTLGPCVGGVINFHEDYFFENDTVIYSESAKVIKTLTANARNGQYKVLINQSGKRQVASIFKQMLKETRNKKIGCRCIVNSLMHQLLITILRNSQLNITEETQNSSMINEKIQDAVIFIETNFTTQIDINQVAKIANMSRSYFHANFKEVTGRTFVDYLNDLRVENACNLLKNTDLDIATVACRSGFTSVSHFYRVFKSNTDTSPQKIRKACL
jgi:AraC-like DNA-binding protein